MLDYVKISAVKAKTIKFSKGERDELARKLVSVRTSAVTGAGTISADTVKTLRGYFGNYVALACYRASVAECVKSGEITEEQAEKVKKAVSYWATCANCAVVKNIKTAFDYVLKNDANSANDVLSNTFGFDYDFVSAITSIDTLVRGTNADGFRLITISEFIKTVNAVVYTAVSVSGVNILEGKKAGYAVADILDMIPIVKRSERFNESVVRSVYESYNGVQLADYTRMVSWCEKAYNAGRVFLVD